MYIPQLQASMAMYEASKFIKEYEKNRNGVQVKTFHDVAWGLTQINDQGMVPKILKPNNDAALKFNSNDHIKPYKQIGGKAPKSTTRVLGMKSYNTQFSREQIKEIFLNHDSNNDGFLDRKELTKAFAFLGSSFPFYKACYGMLYADANKDGLISETELDKLIDYASRFIMKE